MSVEINGYNARDERAVDDLSEATAQLCLAQGIHESSAYEGDAMRGSEYAGRIAFTALRNMKLIPEDFDYVAFGREVYFVSEFSIHPENK
jgi:hypothetical protein